MPAPEAPRCVFCDVRQRNQSDLIAHQRQCVKVERHYSDQWTATTDNYDGPGSPMGLGSTREEAIADLRDQLEERTWGAVL